MSSANPLRWADHLAVGVREAASGDFVAARLAFFRAWPDVALPPLRALNARLVALEAQEPGALSALAAEAQEQVQTMTEILDVLELAIVEDEGADAPQPSFADVHRVLVESARNYADPDADDPDNSELAARERASFGGGADAAGIFDPDPFGRGPIDRDRDGRPDADRFE